MTDRSPSTATIASPVPGTAAGASAAGTAEVLLATYNGARFLREQLDSLLAQQGAAFRILVADDGSSDATPAILADYAAAHPGRFVLLPRSARPLGPVGNFGRLLDAASADHVFFCDQDDVWLPTKVADSLARMAELEARHGAGTPILVHSDLIVVDAEGRTIAPSFFAYSRVHPANNSLMSLLTSNVAAGCTVLVNRALYAIARPVPAEALMTDHWLAQVAASCGIVDLIERPTMRYRQHGANAIGAKRVSRRTLLRDVRETLFRSHSLSVVDRLVTNAGALHTRLGDRLDPRRAAMLLAFARIAEQPRPARVATLVRHRIYKKHGWKVTLGLMVLVLRLRRRAVHR